MDEQRCPAIRSRQKTTQGVGSVVSRTSQTPTDEQSEDRLIELGKIVGVWGLKGWVKVYSYTRPPRQIFDYQRWILIKDGQQGKTQIQAGRKQGSGLVAQLDGLSDRLQAEAIVGSKIAISRDQLAAPEQGEYYWSDLLGLRVITDQDNELGVIETIMETGSNDVMVVKGERERLLPYTKDVVIKIDQKQGVMRVNWDPEF